MKKVKASWTAAGLLVLALAGFYVLRERSLLDRPVGRIALTDDLLASARIGPGADPSPPSRREATYLVAQVKVPERGRLFLEFQRRHPLSADSEDPLAEVTFSITVDAEERFSRTLEGDGPHGRQEVLDLSSYAGREVEVEARIRNADPGTTEAFWRRLQVETVTPVARRPAGDGPNVLLLVVDTLRADHLSLYGYERPTTPFLDRFAAAGRVHDQAVSSAAWTLPAVASLFTGLAGPRHGAVRRARLLDRFETLAETLQSTGLTTVAVSANPIVGHDQGLAQGFEEFHAVPWERAEAVNERFLNWLGNKADVQWFAYLHYIDPHDPYDAPAPEGDRWSDRAYDGVFRRTEALDEAFFTRNYGLPTPFPVGHEDVRFLVDRYDGEITYWDRTFGRLVAELEERGLLESTLVVVTSDHGEEFLDHDGFKHGHQLFDESVRIPLVVRGPAVGAGRTDEVTSLQHLGAEILERLGLATEDDSPFQRRPQGVAFSYLWKAVNLEVPARREKLVAVRTDGWKLIVRPEVGSAELYDLRRDPAESADRAAQEEERTAALRDLVERWLAAQETDAAADTSAVDPEWLEKLRALGYVK